MQSTRLEIGVGLNPQKEDWIHQDIRELPGVDLVCDARKLPYKDGELDEIFSSHVIEHFSWREVKAVLTEWVRTLRQGGKLEMITPNFFKLWENLVLKTEIPATEKWPGGPVTPEFVAYVTGGGQEYPENTHTAHYTFDWYQKTLEDLGCKVKIQFHGLKHPSPSIRIIATKL